MPAVDQGYNQPKKPKKLKKGAKTVVRPPDSGDPLRRAPVVKERMFAHPNRKEPKKVLAKVVKDEDTEKRRVARVKRTVARMDAKPTPSPDALDTYRSPQQKKRDKQVVAETVADSRIKVIRAQHKGA